MIRIKFIIFATLAVFTYFAISHYNKKIYYLAEDLGFNKWKIQSVLDKKLQLEERARRNAIQDRIVAQIIFSSKRKDFLLLFDFTDDDYGVKTYNFNITEPQKIEFYKNTKFYNVVKTEISASFEAKSQLQPIMFLDEISAKIPGYTQIKSLDFIEKGNKFVGSFVLEVYTLKVKAAL